MIAKVFLYKNDKFKIKIFFTLDFQAPHFNFFHQNILPGYKTNPQNHWNVLTQTTFSLLLPTCNSLTPQIPGELKYQTFFFLSMTQDKH